MYNGTNGTYPEIYWDQAHSSMYTVLLYKGATVPVSTLCTRLYVNICQPVK